MEQGLHSLHMSVYPQDSVYHAERILLALGLTFYSDQIYILVSLRDSRSS